MKAVNARQKPYRAAPKMAISVRFALGIRAKMLTTQMALLTLRWNFGIMRLETCRSVSQKCRWQMSDVLRLGRRRREW